jgi:hypothetical protein
LFLWRADQTTVLQAVAGISRRLSESQAHTYTAKKHIMPLSCAAGVTMTNNRNVLYLIIGVLVVALGVVGYNLYEAKKEPEGVQINVGPNGLKIQSK